MTISDISRNAFINRELPVKRIVKLLFPAYCAVVFTTGFAGQSQAQSSNRDLSAKTLMAVFAHPDDEGSVGPILKKYADQGANVVLVIATDGRLGTNEYNNLPPGDSLAAIRRGEMKCAAERLGVDLIHLKYEDQFNTEEGYDGFIPQSRGFIKELHGIVSERQPDAILTWGPDGGSNHIDHRLVGSTVTHVLVSTDWEKTPDVYYVGSPASQIDNEESRILRGVQDKYLTMRIPYSDEDGEVAMRAMQCHESQFPPEMVEKWWNERRGDRENMVYLRPFTAPEGEISSDLFE